MNEIRLNERSLTDAIVLSLRDSSLMLVRTDNKDMGPGYDTALALAQSLTQRVLYSYPVIVVIEKDDR